MIAVLAWNQREAERELRLPAQRFHEVGRRYVGSIEGAMGCEFAGFEVIGEFWKRPDADVLYDAVTHRVR